MNRFSNAVTRIAVLSLGTFVNKLTGAVFFILLARYLGTEGLGRYGFALSFTASFSIISDLGLNILAVRVVSKNPDLADKYISNIGILRLLLAGLTLVVTVITLLVTDVPSEKSRIVMIVACAVFFTNIETGLRWAFQAFKKAHYESILSGLHSTLNLVVGGSILVVGYGLIEVTILQLVLAALSFMVVFWLVVKRITRPVFDFDRAFCWQLITNQIPFVTMITTSTLYTHLNLILLGYMVMDAETGQYNAAYRFIFFFQVVFQIYSFVGFPILSETADQSSREFVRIIERSYRYICIIGLAVAIMTTLFPETLMVMMFGKKLAAAGPVLRYLGWMNLFFYLSNVNNGILIARNREWTGAKIMVIGLLVNTILSLLFIPQWGALGAAMAIAFSEGVRCIIFHNRVLGLLEDHRPQGVFLKTSAAGIITLSLGWWIGGMHVWLHMGVVACTYIAILRLLKVVPDAERKMFQLWLKLTPRPTKEPNVGR